MHQTERSPGSQYPIPHDPGSHMTRVFSKFPSSYGQGYQLLMQSLCLRVRHRLAHTFSTFKLGCARGRLGGTPRLTLSARWHAWHPVWAYFWKSPSQSPGGSRITQEAVEKFGIFYKTGSGDTGTQGGWTTGVPGNWGSCYVVNHFKDGGIRLVRKVVVQHECSLFIIVLNWFNKLMNDGDNVEIMSKESRQCHQYHKKEFYIVYMS